MMPVDVALTAQTVVADDGAVEETKRRVTLSPAGQPAPENDVR